MWVYDPKGAVHNMYPSLFGYFFKSLYGHPRAFDAHQFFNSRFWLSSFRQQETVGSRREQMNEWYLRHGVQAYLLMSAERHLPRWECKESNCIVAHKVLHVLKKLHLVGFFYVLYHIVDQYDVEQVFLRLGFGHQKEIRGNEFPYLVVLLEVQSGIFNLTFIEINACHLASFLGEWQEVSSFAAANLQNFCVCANGNPILNVHNVEFPRRVGKLLKIEPSVFVSLLHNATCFLAQCYLSLKFQRPQKRRRAISSPVCGRRKEP